MKRILFLLIIFLLFSRVVFAAPERGNNKFGISLLQPTNLDIKNAAEMINSQGGDYGYATLVIQENDRDIKKWQGIFDELRKNHLIPIIRLATQPEGENWRRPEEKDADTWVAFLDSLNWVIKKRYIVLFNEPNHATEWGGEVDPESYGKVASVFAQKLKEKNNDYFVMLAGLDASAPHYPTTYEDEELFIGQISNFKFLISNYVDGWVSHSYPNPGFSGSPWDTGRKSIRGYEWELSLLKNLGISKELPVFITETGWKNNRYTADNFQIALENVWGPDNRVVAVTPFVFNYQSEPFLGFSWKYPGEESFYPQYDRVKEIIKQKGEPQIIEKGAIEQSFPAEIVANSNYHFIINLKNTGQAVWDVKDGYQLSAISNQPVPFEYFFSDLKDGEPNRETEASIFIKTNKTAEGEHAVKIGLKKNNEIIAETKPWKFSILPLPKIEFEASLFPKFISNSHDMEIQIYDDKEGLIYKKEGVQIEKSRGVVEEVQNIVIGQTYRIVALKPNYLPRQAHITFKKDKNKVAFRPLLPLDFNNDGRLGWEDLTALLQKPDLLMMFIP
ncbi:hypothetical protein HZC27_05795 [Candidatus Roizmanbacteria bacterium]|nr:hypothetical protein [Candidatus Roizmanbacteria bacterium]